MGIRGAFASLAAVAVLSGCGGGGAAPSHLKPAQPVLVAATAEPFTTESAQSFADIAPGRALHVDHRWPCGQPMRISIAAAPGWTDAQVYDDLLYAVSYLQALGYDVSVVGPTQYADNMTEPPSEVGSVVVVVAPYAANQPGLAGGVAATTFAPGAVTTSAQILLDASRNGLDPDVILHEFGHILGFEHREAGTVMSAGYANSGHFDADETATVTCR